MLLWSSAASLSSLAYSAWLSLWCVLFARQVSAADRPVPLSLAKYASLPCWGLQCEMDFRDMLVDELRREQMLRHWVDVYEGQRFPAETAVKCGHDEQGRDLYVGRCFFHGCVLPANVNPETSTASFVWDRRHQAPYYQVLVGDCFRWQRVHNVDPYVGRLPAKGVRTGEISSGEPVYVGRCQMGRSMLVGNALPSRNALYVPGDEGDEPTVVYDFEMLIKSDLDLPSPSN